MLFMLIATVQVTPAPPAPTARRVQPPPLVSTVAVPPPVYFHDRSGPAARFTVDAEVRGGDAVLWSGPLRVGGNYNQTSVRREQSEPGETECRPGRGVAPITTSFNMTLNARGEQDQVAVNVRWSRPGDQPCAPGPNSRTVEVATTVDLPPGATATLTGDGGLSVRLRRR